MLIQLQGNVGNDMITPIQNDFDDVIFCNVGGKSTMALSYKNIPPMEHNTIPSEIQIKNRNTEAVYTRIVSYNKNCYLSTECTEEIPPFRFQIIYDGYDFLYYPEFKLYERPYLLLDFDIGLGTSIISFLKDTNDAKNLSYLSIGEVLFLKDYNTEYVITNVLDEVDRYVVYLDRDVEDQYYKNDILVFKDIKYELQESSNILNDSTTNELSPFKFKFINNFNSKNYVMHHGLGQSSNYTLLNNNNTTFVDLWGDDKIASISNSVDIEPDSTIILNTTPTETDTEIELIAAPTIPLDVHSYLTIKSDNGLEIVKILEKTSEVSFVIERGQFDTTPVEHPSLNAQLYFPKYVYFLMLPVNKVLSKRYVIYRNIDFVLTWV